MENKKTTELLDLLEKLRNKEGEISDQDKYNEVWDELKSREPFWSIFEAEFDESLPALKEEVEDLKAEIKKLKRHKHDEKTGDVLIRI